MKCEACGYKFLFASSTKCPSCGDPREAIVKESDIQAAMGHANALTNHSVIGKRPFEHDPAVVAVTDEMIAAALGAASGIQLALHDDDAATIYRAMAAVAPFGVIPWTSPVPITESVVGLKAANAHLTRQLAAQALAHAEQMEELRASMLKKSGSQLYAEMMGQAVDQCELTNLHRELAAARAFIERLKAAELSAMRVTPATTKLRCCDNGHTPYLWESDVDICSKCGLSGPFILKPVNAWMNKLVTPPTDTPPPERRPDGTLKPVAKAWEAPKQASDARRIGG